MRRRKRIAKASSTFSVRRSQFLRVRTDSQGAFENLLSFLPPLTLQVTEQTSLLPWLLERIQKKPYDSNKQYASEILAILLQNDRENRLRLDKLQGMDTILRVLSVSLRCVTDALTLPAIPQEGSRRRRGNRVHGKRLQLSMFGTSRARDEEALPRGRRCRADGHHDEVRL